MEWEDFLPEVDFTFFLFPAFDHFLCVIVCVTAAHQSGVCGGLVGHACFSTAISPFPLKDIVGNTLGGVGRKGIIIITAQRRQKCNIPRSEFF